MNIIKVSSAHGVIMNYYLGRICVVKKNTAEDMLSQISNCRVHFAC